jgi:choline dehydrogenase-like flavoprotein
MDAAAIEWDVVIVGTGMGGATIGYTLAKAGLRVLFVERGLDLRGFQSGIIYNRFVEDDPSFPSLSAEEQSLRLVRGGRSQDELHYSTNGRSTRVQPYVGCGTGGSTALYGMVLERLFPQDFQPGLCYPEPGDSSRPDAWPIRYEDLRPWYEQAEDLYRVRGMRDPLRREEGKELLPPPPISHQSGPIFQTLAGQGLHPYQLHVGSECIPGCRTCQGYLCGSRCKSDAATMCLTPAIEEYGACLLTECTALSLDADRTQVRRLHCSWRGQLLELRSKLFILAAGALLTPVLLLNSKSALWPNGLANASGQVGCNLMRHSIDLYVLMKAPRAPLDAFAKDLGCNDFYCSGRGKLGTVQTFGIAPPLTYLRSRPGFNLWRLLGPAGPLIQQRYSQQPILGAIMEDLPYVENRVGPDGSLQDSGSFRLSLRYNLSSADRRRRQVFREAVTQVLRPLRPKRVGGTTDLPALGHVCGTCRFGADPATSVLDPWNRAHGLSNLYVVDGSFFPTSGGTNPALTIAANALRVGQHLQSSVR